MVHKTPHAELGAVHFIGFATSPDEGNIVCNVSLRTIGTGEAFDGDKTRFIFSDEGIQVLKEDIITFLNS